VTRPADDVRAELEGLLAEDGTRLGDVFRGTQRGLDARAIADELGVPTPNFVVNQRTIMRAMLDGQLPSGNAIETQVAGAIRTKLKLPTLSQAARAHLTAVLAELDSRRSAVPVRLTRPAPAPRVPAGSLRQATDAVVRDRLIVLVGQVENDAGFSADDYRSALAAAFALDGVASLVLRNKPCATSETLLRAGASQLTLEHAVLDWASDLPISAELIGYSSERLKFWRS
jgi:hypothetical protein